MHCLRVVLKQDLVAGIDLFFGKDPVFGEEPDALIRDEVRHRIRKGNEVCKTSAAGFLNPLVGVSVSVEEDPLVFGEHLLEDCVYLVLHMVRIHIAQPVVDHCQLVRDSRVQHNVGVCHGKGASGHTELKLVACKRKR